MHPAHSRALNNLASITAMRKSEDAVTLYRRGVSSLLHFAILPKYLAVHNSKEAISLNATGAIRNLSPKFILLNAGIYEQAAHSG